MLGRSPWSGVEDQQNAVPPQRMDCVAKFYKHIWVGCKPALGIFVNNRNISDKHICLVDSGKNCISNIRSTRNTYSVAIITGSTAIEASLWIASVASLSARSISPRLVALGALRCHE